MALNGDDRCQALIWAADGVSQVSNIS